jgi:putative hydrolase of the HAD superfamily
MKNVKVIICDVYRTILQVGEPAGDPQKRWERLYTSALRRAPEVSLEQLGLRCREIIAEDHDQARERGILYPEVNWRSVMERALPELGALSHVDVDDFLFDHAQLFRSLRVMAGCADVFRECIESGILLGIASNAQAYTLRELELALSEAGLNSSIFQPDLMFWSFEHGFSKPDAHVFEILRARLRNRCLSASEALMIGDREDKDIAPASAAGWRTWLLSDNQSGLHQGNWRSLAHALFDSETISS